MIWTEINSNTLTWMKFLGNFSPTTCADRRQLKGWTYDEEDACGSKTYLDANDLREMAAACVEVADWLDTRADESLKESSLNQKEFWVG